MIGREAPGGPEEHRRVWHADELFPRVGFVVTNLRPSPMSQNASGSLNRFRIASITLSVARCRTTRVSFRWPQ